MRRGRSAEALTVLQEALELDEAALPAEPGRADYLRDLSASYERMGDLQRRLDEQQAARQFFEKALQVRERLVAQEPGRADYQVDVVQSLVRMGNLERLQRALGILHELRCHHRLNKLDEPMIAALEELIEREKETASKG